MRMRWWWQDDEGQEWPWQILLSFNPSIRKKSCRWKWSIFLNASSGIPQLFSWFCAWQICTTTLYGDSWMANWMVRSTSCKAVPSARSCPHELGEDWAAAHALLYRKTAKEKLLTQDDHNAIRCVLSHLVSSMTSRLCLLMATSTQRRAISQYRGSGNFKYLTVLRAHNVGVYILNQLGVRNLRQCHSPVWFPCNKGISLP